MISDDSGLEVDAIGGAPGVYSKRYTKEATAEANNTKLVQVMKDKENRTARFRCVVAIVWSEGKHFIEGSCEGTIGHSPKGEEGFGYDPLFIPNGFNGKTMAQITSNEKNTISHRGKAFGQLPKALKDLGLIP